MQVKTRKPVRLSHRSERVSLSPYVIDEVAPTLAEIRAARSTVRHGAASR